MATLLGGLGNALDDTLNNVLGNGGTILNLDLGSLANIGIGAGGTTSVIAVNGTVGTTAATPTSPVFDLGIDLGTGLTGGNGGLLGGLFGGGTADGGGGLVPDTVDALLNT